MYTGTREDLLDMSVPVAEEFGWTMFSVMVRKETLRRVHTTAGETTTVITARMSL